MVFDRVQDDAENAILPQGIDGLPDRLDLSSDHARDALAAGVDLVCSTDAHSVEGLGNMELSVVTARRAAAPRGRVVNTRPLAEILR